jgi:predicted hydrocarbon binding protein
MPPESRTVAPLFPLLILRAMRDLDRPEEILEGEDVSVSLPRRLGLSDVVGQQIHKYEVELKAGRMQPASEVEDLLRLVIRRADAAEIFHAAGQSVARHAWALRSRPLQTAIRFLPQPLARLAANRAGRKLLKRLVGPGRLRLRRWPVELRIENSLTARADPGGSACAVYGGVLEELLQLYTGRSYRAHHEECEARGDENCVWHVRLKG